MPNKHNEDQAIKSWLVEHGHAVWERPGSQDIEVINPGVFKIHVGTNSYKVQVSTKQIRILSQASGLHHR